MRLTDKARISSDGRKANSTPPICDDTGCEIFMLAIWKLASSGSQLEATQNRRRPQKTTVASNKKVSRLAATFRSGEGTSGPATANPALQSWSLFPRPSSLSRTPTRLRLSWHLNFCLELVVVVRGLSRQHYRFSTCRKSALFLVTAWTMAMTQNGPDQHKHHQRRTTMSSAKGAKSPSASLL